MKIIKSFHRSHLTYSCTIALILATAGCLSAEAQPVPFNAHIRITTDNTCSLEVDPAKTKDFNAILALISADGRALYQTTPLPPDPSMLTTVTVHGGQDCTLDHFSISPSVDLGSGTYAKNNYGMSGSRNVRIILPDGGALDMAGSLSVIHLYNEKGEEVTDQYKSTVTNGRALKKQETDITKLWNSGEIGALKGKPVPDASLIAMGYTKTNITDNDTTFLSPNIGGTPMANGTKNVDVEPQNAGANAKKATIGMAFVLSAMPYDQQGKQRYDAITPGDELHLDYALSISPD